jgi:hypothetical protein
MVPPVASENILSDTTGYRSRQPPTSSAVTRVYRVIILASVLTVIKPASVHGVIILASVPTVIILASVSRFIILASVPRNLVKR